MEDAVHASERAVRLRGLAMNGPNGLMVQYLQLRRQLEAAYADEVWDSLVVDEIADRLVPIEFALASLASGSASMARRGHAAQA